MSFLSSTPVWLGPTSDLGAAFQHHSQVYRARAEFALDDASSEWLDALWNRARQPKQRVLLDLTERMLALLARPPNASAGFRAEFESLYEKAGGIAYPFAWAIRNARRAIAAEARDYMLECFDLGAIRQLEDAACGDPTLRSMLKIARNRLGPVSPHPALEALSEVFENYSEALIYQKLMERGGGRLRVQRIDDSSQSNPDFECWLRPADEGGSECELHFFIEVKTLNIVDASLRSRDMRDDAIDAHVNLEGQINEGRRFAFATNAVAPYLWWTKDGRRSPDPDYDRYSIRHVIETLIEKARSAFKRSQFERGPTLALVNLLRLPLPGPAGATLAHDIPDPENDEASISGTLWHVAFGDAGNEIHRAAEFEGAETSDGKLTKLGFLADEALAFPTPAMMFFVYLHGHYEFRGLYDARWVSSDGRWKKISTETVLSVICDEFNDRANSQTGKKCATC
jgi:hypothetical protein